MKFVITKNTITGESSQHMKGLISFLFFFLTPSFFLPKNGGELRVESIDLGGGRRALAPLENWVCTIGFVRHPVIGNISLNGCYQLIWGHHFTVEDSTTALLPQIPCCVSPPGDVLYVLVVKNCHHVVKVVCRTMDCCTIWKLYCCAYSNLVPDSHWEGTQLTNKLDWPDHLDKWCDPQ